MKLALVLLFIFFSGVALDKETSYTASTPAGETVRDFLGISRSDSIDFIRWHLKIRDDKEFTYLQLRNCQA